MLIDENAKNGAKTTMISPIICIHNAYNSKSKPPLTKLLELISNYLMSLCIAALSEKVAFRASNNNQYPQI